MPYSDADISVFQVDQNLWYCQLSAMVLIVYDTSLTFRDEVEHIWKRKISGVTLLYICLRYAFVLRSILSLVADFGRIGLLSCVAIAYPGYIFVIATLLVTAVFSAFRVWAIWRHHLLPVIVILLIGLISPGINIYVYAISSAAYPDDVDPAPLNISCWTDNSLSPGTNSGLGLASRASIVLADSLVLVATLRKTWGIRKAAKEAGIQSKLSSLLIRDGSLYFGILLAMNVTNMVFDITEIALGSLTYFNDAFTCILLTRFILNLRTVDVTDEEESKSFSSRIDFALGNLGASLDHDSSSDHRSIIRATSEQVSRDPLSLGILEGELLEIPRDGVEDGVECTNDFNGLDMPLGSHLSRDTFKAGGTSQSANLHFTDDIEEVPRDRYQPSHSSTGSLRSGTSHQSC